jgi:acyl dehydratase
MGLIAHMGLGAERALRAEVAAPRWFSGFGAQFRKPVFPGERLHLSFWKPNDGSGIWPLALTNERGEHVLSSAWVRVADGPTPAAAPGANENGAEANRWKSG